MTARGRSPAGVALQVGLVVIGLAVAVVVTWLIRGLLVQLFVGLILAAGLLAPVLALERRMPRWLAVTITLVGLVAAVILLLVLVVPPLAAQVSQFNEQLPELVVGLEAWLADIVGQEVVDSWTGGAPIEPPTLSSIVAFGMDLINLALAVVTILIFAALLLLTREQTGGWLANFLPAPYRGRGTVLGGEAMSRLGGYVRGLLGTMAFEGIGVALGAFVLGIPMPLALGGITFLSAAIPYLGSVIMLVPTFILGLSVSPTTAVLIVAWVLILEQIEGLVVTPLIQSKAVRISPLAVLFGVLAGFAVAGFVGGMLAIPIVALIDVVLTGIVFPLQAAKGAEQAAASAVAAGNPSPAPSGVTPEA